LKLERQQERCERDIDMTDERTKDCQIGCEQRVSRLVDEHDSEVTEQQNKSDKRSHEEQQQLHNVIKVLNDVNLKNCRDAKEHQGFIHHALGVLNSIINFPINVLPSRIQNLLT